MMREVRIHLEHQPVAALERPPEASQIRAAEPVLGGTPEHVQPRLAARHPLREVAGSIGRIVVDHEDLDARILVEHERHDAR